MILNICCIRVPGMLRNNDPTLLPLAGHEHARLYLVPERRQTPVKNVKSWRGKISIALLARAMEKINCIGVITSLFCRTTPTRRDVAMLLGTMRLDCPGTLRNSAFYIYIYMRIHVPKSKIQISRD